MKGLESVHISGNFACLKGEDQHGSIYSQYSITVKMTLQKFQNKQCIQSNWLVIV